MGLCGSTVHHPAFTWPSPLLTESVVGERVLAGICECQLGEESKISRSRSSSSRVRAATQPVSIQVYSLCDTSGIDRSETIINLSQTPAVLRLLALTVWRYYKFEV